jgi:hypothetical protein
VGNITAPARHLPGVKQNCKAKTKKSVRIKCRTTGDRSYAYEFFVHPSKGASLGLTPE